MSSKSYQIFLFLVACFGIVEISVAGDPDILTDFIIPENTPSINGTFFKSTVFSSLVSAPPPTTFTVLKATIANFPALNGLSVSMAVLEFPTNSTNPPHTHPRGSELLFVIQGSLQVGLIDTNNTLYTQTLQLGDLFVFPKGLVHFQFNADPQMPALAVSAFGSSNAGTVSIPSTVFATDIPDNILAQSFKTDVATTQKLKAGLTPKP